MKLHMEMRPATTKTTTETTTTTASYYELFLIALNLPAVKNLQPKIEANRSNKKTTRKYKETSKNVAVKPVLN